MPIRMTGLVSGLDTESLVKSLVEAQKLKNKKWSDKLTLSEWKEEKWKDLNAKLYKLATTELDKVRLQGNYSTKKVTSSNESLITATGSNTAPEGAHEIEVGKLASSQYVTGQEIGKDVTGSKTLEKLLGNEIAPGTVIQITNNKGNKSTTAILSVTDKTTINDFVSACKSAGLNANFDTSLGRLFISSKESGADNSFTITTGTVSYTDANNGSQNVLGSINTLIGQDNLSSTQKSNVYTALGTLRTLSDDKLKKLYDLAIQDNPDTKSLTADEKNELSAIKTIVDLAKAQAKKDATTDGVIDEVAEEQYIKERITNNDSALLTTLKQYAKASYTKSTHTTLLNKMGLDEISSEVLNSNNELQNGIGMTLVKASDAEIKLDGATITSSSNTITANGLTINLNSKSAVGQTITLNVANNNQAVYDTIKNFVKTYNSILSEMNTLYYAESARGYDPLSDDEREAMTDDQIEKWEKKIKDSLLRRDNTLSSLLTSMKSAMASSVTVNGKPYSLSSFGITTSTNYSEKGLLHIYGDSEDSTYASSKDKLMAALNEDPETVMQVLTGITGKLYETMQSKMKSIPNVRSSQKFYNDKSLDKEQVDYKKKISELESKLTDLENKYYKQFAAMETTLSKLQSQTNSLMGLLGN